MNARLAIALLFATALSACSTQSPAFSWYHPMGGEYLFAFDSQACEGVVIEGGQTLGVDTQGPFFQCMHQRGYYLVDANGIVQAPPATGVLAERQVTQQ